MKMRRLGLAIVALVAVGCGSGVGHYQSVLDEFQTPDGWEVAATVTKEPGGEDGCSGLLPGCPRVIRYYLVQGAAIDAYRQANKMLSTAEFGLVEEFDPACGARPSSALCVVVAARSSDQVQASVFSPGWDPDGIGFARDDRLMVRVIVQGK